MKNLRIVLVIGLLALFPIAICSQTYSKLWSDVQKAQSKSLPKTAVAGVDKIIARAKADNNNAQLIKAFIVRMQLSEYISADSVGTVLPLVEDIALRQPDGVDKCLWNMTLGWLLSRNKDIVVISEPVPDSDSDSDSDFDFDFDSDQQKIIQAYVQATSNADLLAGTNADNYLPILDKGADSRFYNNDMLSVVFPFVARQLKDMSYPADSLSRDIMAREIAFYVKQGNRHATLLAKLDSIDIFAGHNSEAYQQLATEFADDPLMTAACARLAYSASDSITYNVVNNALQTYPDTKQTNTLKNIYASLTQPELVIYMNKDFVYPDKEVSLCVRHRNTRSFSLQYVRLPYTASDAAIDKLTRKDFEQLMRKPTLAIQSELRQDNPYEFVTDTLKMRIPAVGVYLVKATGDNAPAQYSILHVSRLTVIQLPLSQGNTRLCVVDKSNGASVANATIMLESFIDATPVRRTLKADRNGELVIESAKDYADIFAFTDTDKACAAIGLARSYAYRTVNTPADVRASVYTDRAIYRPGQSVKAGGVLYRVDGDSTSVESNKSVTLELRDANNKLLESATLTTDDFGAFGTEFTLPEECLNGTFRISFANGNATFRVEEYKRPKFYVSADLPDTGYSLGDTVAVKGKVVAYSGRPMGNTTVFCTTVRSKSRWYYGGNYETPQTVRDTLTTDADGNFVLPVVLTSSAANDKSARPVFYTYNVSIKATAADGETEETALYLYAGNKKAWVSLNVPGVICKEQLPRLIAYQNNSAGKHVDGNGRLFVTQDNDTILKRDIVFNASDQFRFLSTLPSGKYTLTIAPTGETDRQNFFTATFSLISLADNKPISNKPLQVWQNAETFRSTDDTVRVLVGTPLKNTWLRYDLMAEDKVVESRTVLLSDTVVKFAYAYDNSYGNGIHARFAIMNEGEFYQQSVTLKKPVPDKALDIKWQTFRNKLSPGATETWTMLISKHCKPVSASVLATMYDASLDKFGAHSLPFRINFDRFFPLRSWVSKGNPQLNMNVRAIIKRQKETPLAFTVPAADLFSHYGTAMEIRGGGKQKRMHKKELLMSCQMMSYKESVPLAAGVNTFAANVEYELDEAPVARMVRTTADQLGEEYDDGNADFDNVALRTDFNETAFFAPSIKTNANGEARIEFKLPQSITSWNFCALAHTRNMDYARIDTVVNVEKPFTVQPNMPRFLRKADKSQLSVGLINNTATATTGKLQLQLTDAQTGKVIQTTVKDFTLTAHDNKAVDFDLNIPAGTSLVVCRTVGLTDNFSDGEQQLIVILSDMQQTLTTRPFTLTDTEEHTIALDGLNIGKGAKNATLTVEYTANPLWAIISSLPAAVSHNPMSATQLAANYASLSIVRQILTDNPEIRQQVKEWQADTTARTPLLAFENNPEVKQLLLQETPWVNRADNEREQLKSLLQDDFTLDLRRSSLIDRLKAMQTPEGGWQWYPGMPHNTWATMEIAETLLRTSRQCPAAKADISPLLKRALTYLNNMADKEMAQLKRQKAKSLPSLWIHYLYISSMSGQSLTPAGKYMLGLLQKNALRDDLYDKSLAACVLHANKRDTESADIIKSLMEHTVATPDMGRYFDGKDAPLFWSMYRIPTQIAALEAMQSVAPQEAEAIKEMKLWLMQSKHTQSWTNPFVSVGALQWLFSNHSLANTTASATKLLLTTAKGETIDLCRPATIGPLARSGYIKTVISLDSLDSAPWSLVIQQADATTPSYGAAYMQSLVPSAQVKATGSKLHLTAKFYQETAAGWIPLDLRRSVAKGTRIKARYEITATRDLDFVSLRAPRAACMEPQSTSSCYTGGGYKSVEDAATTWFFDKLAKGQHTVEEIYNIDRSGTFHTAPLQVQCLYAPEFNASLPQTTINVK